LEVVQTGISDLILIKPKVYKDPRGFFLETFQKKRYHSAGIFVDFVQDNLSASTKGVLRGLHFQTQNAQDKLVSVVLGEVYDVAVDLRRNSPTFKKWFGCILSDINHHQFFVPKGFAHGFYVLSEKAIFQYKCSDYYYPKYESGIMWNDPTLSITWPLNAEPILSDKDQSYIGVADLSPDLLPNY